MPSAKASIDIIKVYISSQLTVKVGRQEEIVEFRVVCILRLSASRCQGRVAKKAVSNPCRPAG